MTQLSEQVTDLKQELASLRVQKISSGAANKVAKMYETIFMFLEQ